MYFSKLLLRGFGKFNQKDLDLKPGLNLIRGDHGSGKTTLVDFLAGMLFGIPQRSGISQARSGYQERRPRQGSVYGGTAYLKEADRSYLVERDFGGSGRTSVLDVQSGRELRTAENGALPGEILKINRNHYLDTRVIREDEEEDPEKAAEELQDYLRNMMLTGSSELDLQKALRHLRQEKKKNDPRPLISRLNQLDSEISTYDGLDEKIRQKEEELKKLNQDFLIEAEKRKRVARRLEEKQDGSEDFREDTDLDQKIDQITQAGSTIGAVEEQNSGTDGDKTNGKEAEENREKKFTDRIPVIIGAGILVVLLITGVVYLLPFESVIRHLFVVMTILFVIFTILDGFRVKGYFDTDEDIATPDEDEFNRVLKELQEESEQREEMEFDLTFAREYKEKKEQLKQEEDQLLDQRQERNRLKHEFDEVFRKKSGLEDEIKAIDCAMAKIRSISDQHAKEAVRTFLTGLSGFVPAVTGDRYREIYFAEDGKLMAVPEGQEEGILLSELPLSDIRQLNLAVRMSVAGTVTEDLPIVIDGTDMFRKKEEKQNFLRTLERLKAQQIIVLCRDTELGREAEAAGIPCHLSELS